MKRGFANTNEGQVYYYEIGKGPSLILLHPSPQSGRIFWRLVPKLSKYFRVIVPDTIGFGLSDPLPKGITIPRLAGAVLNVMDTLDVKNTHLFGFHTGNKIAAALASKWPDRIQGLILCGQTHSLIAEQSVRKIAFKPITDKYFSSIKQNHSAKQAATDHLEWATETFSDLARLWWDKRAIKEFGFTADLQNYLLARIMDLVQSKSSTSDIYTANFKFDFEAAIKKIKSPTLIIEIASAAEAHLGLQAEKLVAIMQNGTHTLIENGDREILEMRPNEINKLIKEFLFKNFLSPRFKNW